MKANELRTLTWQDVRQIVELADAIIHPAPERGWTQEKYYSEILKQFEISTEDSEARDYSRDESK